MGFKLDRFKSRSVNGLNYRFMVTTAIFVGAIFAASSVSAVLILKVKVFKLRLDLYYLVALLGAALLIAFKFIT